MSWPASVSTAVIISKGSLQSLMPFPLALHAFFATERCCLASATYAPGVTGHGLRRTMSTDPLSIVSNTITSVSIRHG